MKKLLLILSAIIILAMPLSAYAESGCTYFDKYGDHDWIYGKTEAGCETSGEAYRDCSECGIHEVQESIAPIGHIWQEIELVKEPDCVNDGEKLVACTVCGQSKSLILPAAGHVYGDWEITKEATCSHSGERITKCVACGETISEPINRTDHNYGEWKISEEATDRSMGKRYRQCDECGATNEDMYYPEGTLYRGMHKSDEVKQMQLALLRLKYLMDKADGIFGKNTEAAVIAFQEKNGIEATGIAYPQTLEAINAAIVALDAEEIVSETAHCMHGFLYSAEGEVIYCAHHAKLVEDTLVKYQQSNEGAEVFDEIYDMWYQELLGMYDEWLKKADESSFTAIENSRGCFFADLEAHASLIAEAFKDEPERTVCYGIEMLMDQCAYVCEFMSAGE